VFGASAWIGNVLLVLFEGRVEPEVKVAPGLQCRRQAGRRMAAQFAHRTWPFGAPPVLPLQEGECSLTTPSGLGQPRALTRRVRTRSLKGSRRLRLGDGLSGRGLVECPRRFLAVAVAVDIGAEPLDDPPLQLKRYLVLRNP